MNTSIFSTAVRWVAFHSPENIKINYRKNHMNTTFIVSTVWRFCATLRDDGVG